MPIVSVVIPCYNAGEWIEEAVDSILAQTYKNYEIIIVNDGSTDTLTKEKLRKYEHSFTQVIHQENKGLAGARNTGIRHSKGKYILPLDADDMFRPTFLEKAVSVMENSPRVGVVTCWAEKFGDQKGLIVCPKTVKKWSILISNHIIGTSLFRKVCWEEVDKYDESMRICEDWEFWIRILTLGWKRYSMQAPLFRYRVRAKSLSRIGYYEITSTYIYNKHRNLYKKHFWKILQSVPSMLWRNPYLVHPKYRFYPYQLVLACRDNLHPIAYTGLQIIWRWGLFPVYRLLLAVRNKVKRRPSVTTA